jgi:Rod binding domain-containing protein
MQISALSPELPATPLSPASSKDPAAAKIAAKEFESAFLAEMLRHAGFGAALTQESGFGGEAMATFMVAELASRLADREDFGVAAKIEAKLASVP